MSINICICIYAKNYPEEKTTKKTGREGKKRNRVRYGAW